MVTKRQITAEINLTRLLLRQARTTQRQTPSAATCRQATTRATAVLLLVLHLHLCVVGLVNETTALQTSTLGRGLRFSHRQTTAAKPTHAQQASCLSHARDDLGSIGGHEIGCF